MTDTMKERIAHIIEPIAWLALGVGDTGEHKRKRDSSLRKAGQILHALYEPTEGMVDAAQDPQWIDIDIPDHAAAWQAMIDHIRSEGKE